MKIKKYLKFWKYPRLVNEREILIEERDSLKDHLKNLNQEKQEMIREKNALYERLGKLSLTIPELQEISPKLLDISVIKNKAREFRVKLDTEKERLAPTDFGWYPYNTLTSFETLELLLTGKNRFLLELTSEKPIVDIGCADGDLAFFLESLGCKVQVVDYAPTNFNHMQGVNRLKTALASSVDIHNVNLDSQFVLPEKNYSLVFFLGILYHLKNPYYALETLAKSASYCLISTRVTKFNTVSNAVNRVDLSSIPTAYLLDELEANNDSTNYWIFSNAGLRRILHRTGWDICDYITVGNTEDSDPASREGDERAYCLVKSRFYQD
jgi:tRNA (mo5U34)-methyltransferase